ncbi:FAD-dependent oxidoreductase [Noviherbaspirillum sp.]|uniref:FAD-dependent oxidoreductase n=1 Tax=Noviherbaspirillum sp. TaxID=1926288 RepID=UPI002D4F5B74|nr:FAD-dependent oxidoreductase [Noviherbaspirillum sp.]HZW19733.1 FAD-dependent oxidoreductase [Noviherbaspirillum sp.]
MEKFKVDVAVIGAGNAGISAYHAAARLGKRAVLIDRGCGGAACSATRQVASKLLFAAAEAAHSIEEAEGVGVHAVLRHIDGRALMKRIQAECERFDAFSRDPVSEIPAADLIHGHGRFLNTHCLQAGERIVVEAASVVIATGSRVAVPGALAGLNERLLTPDTLFELDTLPYSVAVIGAGPAGLALGQALHRLGVRVGIFESGSGFAALSDPVVRNVAARCVGEGMDVRRNVELLDARWDHASAILRFKDDDGQEFVERFAYVLIADRSIPDVHRLGLENTGLELDSRGVPAFTRRTLQCGDSSIFMAAGGALSCGPGAGELAGGNAARYPEVQECRQGPRLDVCHTAPQIATTGTTFSNLPKQGYAVGEAPLDIVSRNGTGRRRRGVLRVYGEIGTGLFLGAEMVGPEAGHIAQLLSWAHRNTLSIGQILDMPFHGAAMQEELRSALISLQGAMAKPVTAWSPAQSHLSMTE